METNEDKCHLIISTNEPNEIQIGDFSISNSASEKFLGINIDSKHNFDCHVNHIYHKENEKFRSIARVTPYMTLEKKKIVMNSFFNAQFNYCPLIWMLQSRGNNDKLKFLHERYLRLIYSDKNSFHENLLEKDISVSIHHKNIQTLEIEMFKVNHKLCTEITSDIFMEKTNNYYSLHNHPDFITPRVHGVFCGTKSISYLERKICDIVLEDFKRKK